MSVVQIDPLSISSSSIEAFIGDHRLGSATGFIVIKNEKPYLITNWHVASGRHPETDQPTSKTGGIPSHLQFTYWVNEPNVECRKGKISLHDQQGNPRWLEHSVGRKVDVVAIPLNPLPFRQCHFLDLALANTNIIPTPGSPLFIIGFPLEISVRGFMPIWKTGHIASEHDIDYQEGKPAFLIDATTRGGMSGSPVIIRTNTGYTSHKTMTYSASPMTRFLGVYSGRVHADSEIGIVWRPSTIDDILRER